MKQVPAFVSSYKMHLHSYADFIEVEYKIIENKPDSDVWDCFIININERSFSKDEEHKLKRYIANQLFEAIGSFKTFDLHYLDLD